MANASSRLVVARGGAYERGVALGRAAATRIRQILALQELADAEQDGTSLRDWLPVARGYEPFIREDAPTTWAEMEGTAVGEELPLEQLLLLTCVYEKHMGKASATSVGPSDHHLCTACGAAAAATASGELLCGQNNDEAVAPWAGAPTTSSSITEGRTGCRCCSTPTPVFPPTWA